MIFLGAYEPCYRERTTYLFGAQRLLLPALHQYKKKNSRRALSYQMYVGERKNTARYTD